MSWKFRSGLVLLGLFLLTANHVSADISPSAQSSLQSLTTTDQYTNGLPESVVPGPGGVDVYFLRSGPTDNFRCLFMLDTSTGVTQKILDPAVIGLSRKGLTSFQVSKDGKEILVPYAGKIFVIRVQDRRLLVFAGTGYIDPVLSPDGRYIAAVKNNDIVVINVSSGASSQVTTGGSESLTHGLPDLVSERDFGRTSGFWWSPDSAYIAYEESDTSEVTPVHLVDFNHTDRAPVTIHYSFAGTANAAVRIGIVPITGGSTVWAKYNSDFFPYVLRVVWQFKNAPLSLVVDARDQKEESMLAVSPTTGAVQALVKQTGSAWVSAAPDYEHSDLSRVPYWLSDGSGFLWLTNRHGDWQIELYSSKGELVRTITPLGMHVRSIDDVVESTGTIYFEASSDPTQCQIYQTDFRADAATQLTHADGLHYALFSSDHASYADTYSLSDDEVGADVFATANDVRLARLPSLAQTPSAAPSVKFFQLGTEPELDAAVVYPTKFNTSAQYPVIVRENGVPGSSAVVAGVHEYLDSQWYADQGYIVVAIDCHGAPDRSRLFEEALKYNVASTPINDQVLGLPQLAKDVPQMDMSRVAVLGSGLGGYIAAMALARRPDIFTCAVAVSPIVDWRLVDTAFAERYLDTPEVDPVGYKAADLLTYTDSLTRPLLILQDASQNSVNFIGSLRLTQSLYDGGKNFAYIPISSDFTADGQPVDQVSYHSRVLQYLNDQLHPAPLAAN